MSRPPLSPAQAGAVRHSLSDVCVTAGAGSGKTRVLAERYIHVVNSHGLAVRDVAALTFTEKAASEMRVRIAAYFEAAGDERSRAEVEFAPISTIHAFCARLLRLHAIEAGVDPAFRMLDAAESALLRDDAATLATHRLEAESPEVFVAYRLLTRGDARDTVLSLLERLRGAGTRLDALAWISSGRTLSAVEGDVRAAVPEFRAAASQVPTDKVERVAAMADEIDTLLRVPHASAPEELARFAFGAAQAADRVAQMKFSRKSAYVGPRKALTEALTTLAGVALDQVGETEVLPALQTLLAAFQAAYTSLKREATALDFTDLELHAVSLLERMAAEGLAPDLAPKALLVDEFQDTNPLQARLLALLRARAPQFSVGDPKQSIYRFRRADVGVILAEHERVGPQGQHALATSYRSHPALVARMNALTDTLFANGAAGVGFEALKAGAAFAEAGADPLIRFTLVDVGSEASIPGGRRAEAKWIASEIRELVDQQVPRLASGAEGRPIGFGDVALLLRARTSMQVYERALAAADIPYVTLKGQGFLEAEEIADLLYVLRVIENPTDAYALACVATGPAMAATDVDLLRWFDGGRVDDGAAAWARLQAEADAGGPYAEAVQALQTLRAEAIQGRLSVVVEGALHRLGLLDVALAGPGGERRAANLRKTIALARRMESKGERGLGDLLRHLANLRERAVGEAEAAVGGQQEPVVRLMTVHGAKGLEFPVVFLADAGRAVPGDKSLFQIDGGQGIATKLLDPVEGIPRKSGGYLAQAEREQQAAQEESLRLLYVAMTRAEERLTISAPCVGFTKKDGFPGRCVGWARALFLGLQSGTVDVPMDILVRDVPDDAVPVVTVAPASGPAPDAEVLTDAKRRLARADADTAPLGNTRFVVTVSELLGFAASPPAYYARTIATEGQPLARMTPDGIASETPALDLAPTGRVDRSAIGRAVHAVLEQWRGDDPAPLIEGALRAEFPLEVPPGVAGEVRAMVTRFVESEMGRRVGEGTGVRREVDFHVRVKFPDDARVAGFPSLLVKGSIDLWIGDEIYDYKTNRKSARFPTPHAVADYYGWQLRLYALAAERLLDADVAGAGLLLLDPSFGKAPARVPIDISGEALLETRALCMAFARAELEGRYPAAWQRLLA